MAQHKSAEKQIRYSERRKQINNRNKSILRRQIKKMRTLIANKERENALKLLPEIFSIVDRTVKKGAIHKRTGDRYKSRISQGIESINPTSSQ
jgi:small subunit ribosomal protein S20